MAVLHTEIQTHPEITKGNLLFFELMLDKYLARAGDSHLFDSRRLCCFADSFGAKTVRLHAKLRCSPGFGGQFEDFRGQLLIFPGI